MNKAKDGMILLDHYYYEVNEVPYRLYVYFTEKITYIEDENLDNNEVTKYINMIPKHFPQEKTNIIKQKIKALQTIRLVKGIDAVLNN